MILAILLIIVVLSTLLWWQNKSMFSKKSITNFILLFLLMIAIVFFVNHIMTIGPYKDINIAQDNDWISFWGSLLGGAFGGIATLFVIVVTSLDNSKNLEKTIQSNKDNLDITLNHSTNQFIDNRRSSEEFYFDDSLRKVRPYMGISMISLKPDQYYLEHELYINRVEDQELVLHDLIAVMRVTNIGIASSINLAFILDESNKTIRINGLYHREGEIRVPSIIYLKPDESIDIGICMPQITFPNSGFIISIQFSDLYKNRWKQDVYLQMLEDSTIYLQNVNPPLPLYINKRLAISELK